MDRLYRFSPIKNKEELLGAIDYVVVRTTELGKMVTGQLHYISSLTIFSHFPDEFENLKKILLEMGDMEAENNGPLVKLKTPIKAGKNNIKFLRIRKPDPYRAQVGCADFITDDYETFKKDYLDNHPQNLRLFKRPEYEMIEFFDLSYDVLAYVLSRNPYEAKN
jgi:hypothetical protein